jgi:sarcosine oxidase gamma subunit
MSAAMSLKLEEHSPRPRCGCKGPGAEGWLRAQGYRVPADANSAVLNADGVLVARLATSEFLLEPLGGGAERVAATRAELTQRRQPATVYPIARQDFVVTISGPGLDTLLRQVCSVDFAPLLAAARADDGPVVLTSMIGVGVIAWPRLNGGGADAAPAVTLWCEPSYAHYFWNTLLEVADGQGGLIINRAETASAAGSN